MSEQKGKKSGWLGRLIGKKQAETPQSDSAAPPSSGQSHPVLAELAEANADAAEIANFTPVTSNEGSPVTETPVSVAGAEVFDKAEIDAAASPETTPPDAAAQDSLAIAEESTPEEVEPQNAHLVAFGGETLADEAQPTEEKSGWFARIRKGLSRSSHKLSEGMADFMIRQKLDDEALEAMEELLIASDLGVKSAARLSKKLSRHRFDANVDAKAIKEELAEDIEAILSPFAVPLIVDRSKKPHVILVVGVNGSGKTTTIGKLAKYYRDHGLAVSLVAGDTFRAAAVEQLKVWGERAGCPVVSGAAGADSAGLAFDALAAAKKRGDDLVLIDTAGRLQNKSDLMAELEKIIRVIKKQDASLPHDVLLVLDATVGQNAHSQVEHFRDITNVTGLIVTKLDGTARGGVVVALAERFALPIHAIGVGESVDDMRPFKAKDFARSLVGLED